MSTQRQSGSMGDELTNILMVGLAALFGLILAIRGAGSVAAFVTGADQPQAGITGGLAVLFNPGDPAGALHADGLNPIAYWTTLTLMLGFLGAAGAWGWMKCRRHSRAVDVDPHRLAGTTTSHEVTTAASAKAGPPRQDTPPVPGRARTSRCGVLARAVEGKAGVGQR
jgi:hypothetical protein